MSQPIGTAPQSDPVGVPAAAADIAWVRRRERTDRGFIDPDLSTGRDNNDTARCDHSARGPPGSCWSLMKSGRWCDEASTGASALSVEVLGVGGSVNQEHGLVDGRSQTLRRNSLG